MKRFLTFSILTLIFVTLLLITLAGCGGCVPGDASEACIMQAVHATETSAAGEWHVQQTLQAEETK